MLNTRGHGVNYALDVVENSIEMGPVLPYDKSSERVIQLKNLMPFPLEVFSTEFDKQFIEEEEILKRYDPLNTDKGDPIFETLRKAGSGFWKNIREADEQKRNYEAMQDRIGAIEERLENDFKPPQQEEKPEGEGDKEGDEQKEPEPLSEEQQKEKEELEKEKSELEQKLTEIDSTHKVEKVVKPKVKPRDRLSVIIFGPEKCGKSTLAYFLSEEHQRGIVSLADLLSW